MWLCIRVLFLAFAVFSFGCGNIRSDSSLPLSGASPIGDYLVVSLVAPQSDYYHAAVALAERHQAEIVMGSCAAVADILPELQRRQPNHVAFLVEPNELDLNLVRAIFRLSTQVDDDPFVDFAWGLITGRDGHAALKLVNSSDPKRLLREPAIAMLGVGSQQMGKSNTAKAYWMLRDARIPLTAHTSCGESDENRDEQFLQSAISQLSGAPILILASHGYPDGLVGGPKAGDMRQVNLSGSIVFNIACYTGVTHTWYEDDWTTRTVRQRQVASDQSFCLQMIDNGVAAYIAYLSPRPAGPIMMGDAMLTASSGKPIGELRRADANRVVLAHLLADQPGLIAEPILPDQPLAVERTPASVVMEMSTGGVLFGDPAFIPFSEMPGTDPRLLSVAEAPDKLEVKAQIITPTFHFYASEQLNYWDDRLSALRIETSVLLGNRQVDTIRVLETPAGIDEYQFAAAIEHHRGERCLHLKVTFPQPTDLMQLQQLVQNGVSARFEIITQLAGDRNAEQVVWRGAHDRPIIRVPIQKN